MRTTGCDLCERAIKDRGYLYDLVEAQVLRSDATPLRIAGWGEILSLHLCAQCTAQVQRLMHAIRSYLGCAWSVIGRGQRVGVGRMAY